jgi:phage terminase large subunit-like protein
MSKTATISVTPTKRQRAFLTAPERMRLYIGGIKAGKTFAGALEVLRQPAGSVGMVVAPTYTMLKDASFKTFRRVTDDQLIDSLNRSDLKATLCNGTEVLFRSADKPERLRGPNLGWVWLDEGAYCKAETWDVLLGRISLDPGRIWVTTTPRGQNWLYDVFGPENRGEDYALIRARTEENPHLPRNRIRDLRSRYTQKQARQELAGEFVAEGGGGVFQTEWIEEHRTSEAPDNAERVVIGVDPAGSHRPDSDDTGIVVTASHGDHAYVLTDASGTYDAPEWASRVRRLYDHYQADLVVAEKNYGGDMVESTLRAYGGKNLNIEMVSATRGKTLRAEPLAAPYEQGRVHHVGTFEDLERQMTTYDPQDKGAASPDRMDALVFALRELILGERQSEDWTDIRAVWQ